VPKLRHGYGLAGRIAAITLAVLVAAGCNSPNTGLPIVSPEAARGHVESAGYTDVVVESKPHSTIYSVTAKAGTCVVHLQVVAGDGRIGLNDIAGDKPAILTQRENVTAKQVIDGYTKPDGTKICAKR
jgi:hypothetical protein